MYEIEMDDGQEAPLKPWSGRRNTLAFVPIVLTAAVLILTGFIKILNRKSPKTAALMNGWSSRRQRWYSRINFQSLAGWLK